MSNGETHSTFQKVEKNGKMKNDDQNKIEIKTTFID